MPLPIINQRVVLAQMAGKSNRKRDKIMIDIKMAKDIYEESKCILQQVQLDNGGCLATPEHERYPYIYPRDHSLIILGFLSGGLIDEAKKGLEFILSTHTSKGAFPQRVDMNGEDASYKPIQIDGTGLILYTLAVYIEKLMI